MSYELEAEAIFNTHRPRKTTLVDSVLAYVQTRIARNILSRDLEKFEAGQVEIKYPDAYIKRLRRSLALITKDLHDMRTFFKRENVRVTDEPVEVSESSIMYDYWIKGRTGKCGASSHVMRKDVKRYVQYYLTERVENDG